MVEIGSEFDFHFSNNTNDIDITKINKKAFVFSGRTAIETVIKSIPNINKVLLPSYCCDSMIAPFRKHQIAYEFYDVNYENGLTIHMQIPEDCDVILFCNYFGFQTPFANMDAFFNRKGVIIEDITHSLLSEAPYHKESTYLVASLRKWGPVLCGGYCFSKLEDLHVDEYLYPPKSFIDIKKEAMLLKYQYLHGNAEIDKALFLDQFKMANTWLANHYTNYLMDEESFNIFLSMDFEEIKQIRKTNANLLYKGLKDCSLIDFLFDQSLMDCPLFLPIIVKDGYRDALRKYLIEENIYCPIHWPKPNENCESNLYDMELSLICDQRYNEEDMKRMVNTIQKFTENR